MYIEGDIPNVVTSNGAGNGYGNGFFGGDWAWMIVILLIFGWGNGNYGFGGGGQAGAAQDYVLVSDFAQIERKLDNIESGICDSTFALNNTAVNGFNGLTQNLMTSGFETRSAISDLSAQLAQCCCEAKTSILENRYIDAQNTCALQSAIATSTRDIVDGQRASTDAILGFLTNEKISSLQAQNASLSAQISQNAQTSQIINTLRPVAMPAYITCSPYESAFGRTQVGYGCSGCNV